VVAEEETQVLAAQPGSPILEIKETT